MNLILNLMISWDFFLFISCFVEKKDMVNVNNLLVKPLWQMSGEEYVALHAYACAVNMTGPDASHVTRIKGVSALAEYCACSPSQVAKFLREGVLDSAIISRIGKSIVFDGEKARLCANEYQEQQRSSRRKIKNK